MTIYGEVKLLDRIHLRIIKYLSIRIGIKGGIRNARWDVQAMQVKALSAFINIRFNFNVFLFNLCWFLKPIFSWATLVI